MKQKKLNPKLKKLSLWLFKLLRFQRQNKYDAWVQTVEIQIPKPKVIKESKKQAFQSIENTNHVSFYQVKIANDIYYVFKVYLFELKV